MNALVSVLMVFASVATGILGVLEWYHVRREHHELKEYLVKQVGQPQQEQSLVVRWADHFNRSGHSTALAQALAAGNLKWTPAEYRAGQLAVGLFMVLVGMFFALALPLSVMLALLAVNLGSRFFLYSRRESYVKAINRQLPEVARLMANALRAGLTVHQGVDIVARTLKEPAGPLFQRLQQELKLHVPLETALENLARTTPSPEFGLMTSTVLLQRQVGGDLAGVMEHMSTTLTEREQAQLEVSSLTAESRSVAYILPFMPLLASLILNIVIPGFLNVLMRLEGAILLVVFLFVQFVGFLLVRHVAQVKV